VTAGTNSDDHPSQKLNRETAKIIIMTFAFHYVSYYERGTGRRCAAPVRQPHHIPPPPTPPPRTQVSGEEGCRKEGEGRGCSIQTVSVGRRPRCRPPTRTRTTLGWVGGIQRDSDDCHCKSPWRAVRCVQYANGCSMRLPRVRPPASIDSCQDRVAAWPAPTEPSSTPAVLPLTSLDQQLKRCPNN